MSIQSRLIAMFLLSALSIIGALDSANAADDPSDYVVKIASSDGAIGTLFKGSGVIVTYKNSVYILTSEHVVLHDNDRDRRHEFHLDGQAPQTASYMVSDWGMGLALMKVNSLKADPRYPALEDLAKSSPPSVDSEAISVGFPLSSTSITADSEGRVASTTNASTILVDVEQMLEIKGAHAEFGMSGGAVIGQSGAPIGILSHETPVEAGKVIYAIPIREAAKWAIRHIEQPELLPYLARTSYDLLSMARFGFRVRSQKLVFSTASFPYRPSETVIEINGQRIDEPEAPTRLFPGEFATKASERFRPLLGRGDFVGYYPVLYVRGFRPRAIFESSSLEWEPTGNLVEFLRQLRKNEKIRWPIAMLDYQGRDGSYLIHQFSQNVQFVKRSLTSSGELGRVLQRLVRLVDFLDNPSGGYLNPASPVYVLRPADLDWVLNSPDLAEDWRELRSRRADIYENLRSAIEDMRKALNYFSV